MFLTNLSYLNLIGISYSWAGEGHDMIGKIALNNMAPGSGDFVCSVLQLTCPLQPHINELGRWADKPPDNLSWTQGLHFANIPYHSCGGFDLSRDCSKDCIVSALVRYIITSMDNQASQEDRQVAIKMVIHLIGDIHNPVHMGYREDKGGNNIPVGGFANARYPANLHNLWDFHIPIRFKNTPFAQNITPPQKDQLVDSFTSTFSTKKVDRNVLESSLKRLISDIATETTSYVCQAYRHMAGDGPGNGPWIQAGDSPGPIYMNRMTLVGQDRIRKAGVRLGKMLDFISTHQVGENDPNAKKDNTTWSSVVSVIVTMSVCVILMN